MPEPSDGVTTMSATISVPTSAEPIDASMRAYKALREKAADERCVLLGRTWDLAVAEDRSDFFVRDKVNLTATAQVIRLDRVMGAWDGPPGPSGPQDRSTPHVYARHPASGSGNCFCGAALADQIHTEAAPGVPIPEAMRHG